jgi:hypothetical protein
MFSCTRIAEECAKAVVRTYKSIVRWHLTVRLNTMFKAVQLPASIADLHTSLPNMD